MVRSEWWLTANGHNLNGIQPNMLIARGWAERDMLVEIWLVGGDFNTEIERVTWACCLKEMGLNKEMMMYLIYRGER
jgi:hypothetical protein